MAFSMGNTCTSPLSGMQVKLCQNTEAAPALEEELEQFTMQRVHEKQSPLGWYEGVQPVNRQANQ